ncbi:hypothetical protein EWM64_g3011 [Hericium alpestre]|uniref:GH16 domain-containing protein n=1 Tax=Hericium alpestre TaxID=135208 RepID=A0A4Z0A3V1_9AGAM|nr:hypothetical protein EWM64_g3011 [Hericium alpestre]
MSSPSQRRFYASNPNTPSAVNLLPPSAGRTPGGSVQATFAAPSLRSVASTSSLTESPYPSSNPRGKFMSQTSSIADKFSLAPDPASWGADISPSHKEADDELHNPDPRRDRKTDQGGSVFTGRGLANLGCLALLGLGITTLFLGYPLISYFSKHSLQTFGGFNLGGINGSGQVPSIGNWGLIDIHTPNWAHTRKSFHDDGVELQLVWSDEFNTDGRTFYPGDDPYWEAVDLHYWQTNNIEWYDPAAVTTKGGALEITLSQKETHGLNYQGGLMSTWNKFCFTASVNGDKQYDGVLSFLPGQRLSRCTCPGESHPGPMHEDGSYVGRSAPEIDIFEAQITGQPLTGQVSQSAQFGPFNAAYQWFNTSDNLIIPNPDITAMNTYQGGAFQQAVSSVSQTDQNCYEIGGTACFSVYGFEYQPGFDKGYISWINDNKTMWTLNEAGMLADTRVEISARPIPQEPMYIIANLGMSTNFGTVDLEHLTFPTKMRIDYIRVYQHPDEINIGCDPPDFPTSSYIQEYIDAYMNPNLTTWRDDYGQPFPKNKFLKQC